MNHAPITVTCTSGAGNTVDAVGTFRDKYVVVQSVRYGTDTRVQVIIRHRCLVAFDVTLERRIRELRAQAVKSQDTDELQPFLAELRHALREHLRDIVAEHPFSPESRH
jgi:hypothetical protein